MEITEGAAGQQIGHYCPGNERRSSTWLLLSIEWWRANDEFCLKTGSWLIRQPDAPVNWTGIEDGAVAQVGADLIPRIVKSLIWGFMLPGSRCHTHLREGEEGKNDRDRRQSRGQGVLPPSRHAQYKPGGSEHSH